tara:strand:- start:124 stop:447 length:324 start_codon:yes stop_codon:yes gene_type:complete
MKEKVIEQLKTVYDPEIPVNIYDLGLIYNLDFLEKDVKILMSLTSPFCPVAEELPQWVKEAVLAIDEVESASVEVTFDPPWGQHMMSEEAKAHLDMWNDPPMDYYHK